MTTDIPDTHGSSPAPAPLALKSNEGLGAASEARDTASDYFSEAMMAKATMAPWEEAMVSTGMCPKCSDSLIRVSESDGLRFDQCLGCGCVFVLSATEAPNVVANRAPGTD